MRYPVDFNAKVVFFLKYDCKIFVLDIQVVSSPVIVAESLVMRAVGPEVVFVCFYDVVPIDGDVTVSVISGIDICREIETEC